VEKSLSFLDARNICLNESIEINRLAKIIMKRRHKRISFIILGLAALGIATALLLSAFQSNLVFFFSPSQVLAKEAPVNRTFRVGGLVETGTVKRQNDGLTVHFTVTDTAKSIPVVYKGILPDLFKEGKGCVAQGRLGSDGVFYADQVLAKHDENYMPPEAGRAIDAAKHEREAAKSVVR
jgi:cytochrome c-type biogenesis protein CcmE